MSRPRLIAAVALAVLVPIAGCTSTTTEVAAPSGTSEPTTTAAAPSSPTTSLTFPAQVAGEVARSVYASENQPAGTLENAPEAGVEQHVVGEPEAGRDYVIQAACLAGARQSTVTYRLLDARESSAQLPVEQRAISAGELPCDGTTSVNSAGPLPGPVQVEFDGRPADVIGIYVVVVPA
ncbi:MAG: hypothetical protein JWQ99_3937 [Blastococcus sp.]|jgi:hypothetical protein|nr:hypothetical protein [Blastococcus sp.]